MKTYYVYIMTNKPYGTLYVGITSNLEQRVFQHKKGLVKGFTEKYKLHDLVYFEETQDAVAAIQREKNLKHWIRDWKIEMINRFNPEWKDLSLEWMDPRVEPEDDKVLA